MHSNVQNIIIDNPRNIFGVRPPYFVDLVRFTVCAGQIFKETRREPSKKENLTSQPNA